MTDQKSIIDNNDEKIDNWLKNRFQFDSQAPRAFDTRIVDAVKGLVDGKGLFKFQNLNLNFKNINLISSLVTNHIFHIQLIPWHISKSM